MSIEAMKLALEALEEAHPKPYNESVISHVEAVTALRTAIAEAESVEPVEQDAKQWGNRLNDASLAATHAWDRDLMGPMSGAIFNNIKGVIRVAILKYLEGYTTPPAAQPAAWDYDKLHAAWLAVGGDVAGLSWTAFTTALKEEST